MKKVFIPSKKLEVYEVSNCLNKKLITHFICYLEKEKRYDIKLFQLIEY